MGAPFFLLLRAPFREHVNSMNRANHINPPSFFFFGMKKHQQNNCVRG